MRGDVQAEVQNIISSVIKELAWNPDRKFIYVEQAFFQRWWAEADAKTQSLTQQLVAAGQLEFINGGWCMHDEATPSFVDMIDQTTLGEACRGEGGGMSLFQPFPAAGHRLLVEQFGVMPKTTWQARERRRCGEGSRCISPCSPPPIVRSTPLGTRPSR